MAAGTISDFKGEVPKRVSELKDSRFAEETSNCKLETGELMAFDGLTTVNTPTKVGTKRTIYLWGGSFWFHWTTDVDVVRGPVEQDTSERTYNTDGTQPKMTYAPIATSGGGTNYPNNSYNLGAPAPATIAMMSLNNPTGAVSGITQSSPAIVTATAHGLPEGTHV